MNRPRRVAALVHRYTGLAMAVFLAIAGLTGATLAWNAQLERVFAPSLFVLPSDAAGRTPLDPFELREAAERASGYAVNSIDWTRRRDAPAFFSIEARPGGSEPRDNEIALDPSTGRILGARRHGDLNQGLINLMPFIYDLHDALALGPTGALILGIVALAWTIDCFLGAYLTFPAPQPARRSPGAFWRRWRPAWVVRWTGGRFKLFYDLHRTGGLWPWALLLIIAWSSVGFNLPQVYDPVMKALLASEPAAAAARVADPASAPRLDWRAAHARARALMEAAALREGFRIRGERLMFYNPSSHSYAYRVFSTRDIGDSGNTQIAFDGDSGRLIALSRPTGGAAETTLRTWISNIHTGCVFGIAMRVVLTATGLAVTILSVTGVWIWWRKRCSRVSAARRVPMARSRKAIGAGPS